MNLEWWEFDPVTFSSNFVSVVSKITDVETRFCEKQQSEGTSNRKQATMSSVVSLSFLASSVGYIGFDL